MTFSGRVTHCQSQKMKEVLGDSRTAQDFVDGMKKAYPELPGADGLGELAKVLYK